MNHEIRCALSPIRIYTDLSRPSGHSILVGYVAELVTSEFRIMGLLGRERLDSDELAALHGLLRHQASELWEFLASEFERACSLEPKKGLEYLAARHSFAFSFEAPEMVEMPKTLIDAVQFGKDKLTQEFRSYLWEKARDDLIQHEGGIRTKFAT
jgi:hypothetical protein